MSEIVADTPAGASDEGGVHLGVGVDPTSGNPAYRWAPSPTVDPAVLPPNHPDSLSPTKIELFIRPAKGEAFERGFQEGCDAAGLPSLRFDGDVTQHQGFLRVNGSRPVRCADTGHSLFWFSPDSRYVQLPLAGTLKEIRVTIDPQHCPLPGNHVSLASRFRECVKWLLDAMGGAVLVDGIGNPVGTDGLERIVDHIHHEVEARSIELERQATTDLGGGRFRVQCNLSFQHTIETRGPRGKVKECEYVYFDAPVLRWGAGRARGAEMAREHLAWLRSHRKDDADLERTLQAAFAALAEARPGQESPSRAHAAAGYIRLMIETLAIGGRLLNPEWIDDRVTDSRRSQGWDEEWLAVKMAPMRAARAAKTQREEGAA